jgi:hypothetical protein
MDPLHQAYELTSKINLYDPTRRHDGDLFILKLKKRIHLLSPNMLDNPDIKNILKSSV